MWWIIIICIVGTLLINSGSREANEEDVDRNDENRKFD